MTFEEIQKALVSEVDVSAGKMMSAPGIKYRNKVFAYSTADKMGFKLGKDFQPDQHGITSFNPLSPFKSKPPLAAWFEIDKIHQDQWMSLARLALEKMKAEMG